MIHIERLQIVLCVCVQYTLILVGLVALTEARRCARRRKNYMPLNTSERSHDLEAAILTG
jgi:hypothetical protein